MAIVKLTKDNFEAEAVNATDTVLIDFYADWCGPCRMLSPVVEEIANETPTGLKVCKINVDEQPALSQQFGVMSIPTLIVMRDGKVVAQNVGAIPKKQILQMLG